MLVLWFKLNLKELLYLPVSVFDIVYAGGVKACFVCSKIVCDFSVVFLRFRLKLGFINSTSYYTNDIFSNKANQ